MGQSGRTLRKTLSPLIPKPSMVLCAHSHQVSVLQHRGFGRTGRAAGEIEGCEIAAVARRQRLLGCPPQQRLVVVARTIARTVAADPNNVPEALDLAGEPGHRRRERGVRDQCRGARVAQQRRQFRAGQAGIERHPHEACRHDGVVGLEIFADIGNEQRDAIALAQPEASQRISEPCDAGVEITIGPSPVVVDDRDMIAAPLRKLTPFRADVHVTTLQVRRDR